MKNNKIADRINKSYMVVSILDDLVKFETTINQLLENGAWELSGGVSVTQIDLLPLYSQALAKVKN